MQRWEASVHLKNYPVALPSAIQNLEEIEVVSAKRIGANDA